MMIKVCGMRSGENIVKVSSLDIDMMGFIFYEKSPRFVPDSSVFAVNCALNGHPGIKKVGVFVNADEEYILGKCLDFHLDAVQLHGGESPEMCESLLSKGPTVIKAFSIDGADDLKRCAAYEGKTSYFLFDTKCAAYGGSGKRFDWSVLDSYKGGTPFILSGGISADSLDDLKTFSHPLWAGIDLNSKFELSPAVKDVEKLSAFIEQFKTK